MLLLYRLAPAGRFSTRNLLWGQELRIFRSIKKFTEHIEAISQTVLILSKKNLT